MTSVLNSTFLILLGVLVGGSLLSLSTNPHWFIRAWDFPRLQIIVVAWMSTFAIALTLWLGPSGGRGAFWTAFAITISLSCWHGFQIFPYTPLASKQARSTATHQKMHHRKDTSTLRVVISNVEMENDQYDLWMKTIRDADPDVLIVLEVDKKWVAAVSSLSAEFPEQVIVPQDNWYGMMMLSKLLMVDQKVRYLVQDDIPSIDAHVRMQDGHLMRVVAVHPRPPEPLRGNDATARDAELTLWGLELAAEPAPRSSVATLTTSPGHRRRDFFCARAKCSIHDWAEECSIHSMPNDFGCGIRWTMFLSRRTSQFPTCICSRL